MTRLLRWVFVIPLGAILVLFLFANRRSTALSFDPFSLDDPAISTWALPLWIWLILAVLVGFAIGAFGMWNSGRELRVRAKADRLELKAVKRQLADAEAALAAVPPPPGGDEIA